MSEWAPLDEELGRWAGGGTAATFWWRDDDACAPTPALERLLELSGQTGVSPGLAVIPAAADPELGEALGSSPGVRVLQHGFAHVNHAPGGEKKAEFGDHRPLAAMSEEIAAGAARLAALFPQRFSPLFVPPWNRMAPALIPALADAGLEGISAFAPRPSPRPSPGLVQVNAHVDLIDWRDSRRFKGAGRLAREIAAHLAARRCFQVDAGEPTGILSHHLEHGDDAWRFLGRLIRRTRRRGNARWLSPEEAAR